MKRELVKFLGILVCLVGASTVGSVGCERADNETSAGGESEASKESPGSGESPAEEASTKEAAGTEEDEWQQVESDELGEDGGEMLQQAQTAQKALGKNLKQELKSAVSEESFSGAVDFCHSRAPEIADEVAESHDVAIGRTSHRLRNPKNAPPDWAEEAVEAKKAREYVYRGPNGELGYLRPIKLKGLCVNCHGGSDQLAEGVPEALEEDYPEDEATGFEVGDLRGWFWVEVSAGAS